MQHTHTWRFHHIDTWFFRESRPHETVGGAELTSLFPPPARTILGALRTMWGEALNVNWHEFAKAKETYLLPKPAEFTPVSKLEPKLDSEPKPELPDIDLIAAMGRGTSLGTIKAQGPWVCWNEKRLYPVPTFMFKKTDGTSSELFRLQIGAPVNCDLGSVCLPILDNNAIGAKPLENTWVTAEGFTAILQGSLPDPDNLYAAAKLYTKESRLGIARNNQQRTAIDGLLYQTSHIRPKDEIAIDIDITNIDTNFLNLVLDKNQDYVRLGAEGRMATVEKLNPQTATLPNAPNISTASQDIGIFLTLLTPAHCASWYPDEFTCTEIQYQANKDSPSKTITVWKGILYGIELILISAVLGKVYREGGWDLAAGGAHTPGGPRSIESLIPAGSTWYCQVANGNIQEAITALHGKQIGANTELGRGIIAVGLWPKTEAPPELL